MDDFKRISPQNVEIPQNAVINGDFIYLRGDPSAPQIGDARIFFEEVPVGPTSFIGEIREEELVPFKTVGGDQYFRIQAGAFSLEKMLDQAGSEGQGKFWAFRILGFLIAVFGFCLALPRICEFINLRANKRCTPKVPGIGSAVLIAFALFLLLVGIVRWKIQLNFAIFVLTLSLVCIFEVWRRFWKWLKSNQRVLEKV